VGRGCGLQGFGLGVQGLGGGIQFWGVSVWGPGSEFRVRVEGSELGVRSLGLNV